MSLSFFGGGVLSHLTQALMPRGRGKFTYSLNLFWILFSSVPSFCSSLGPKMSLSFLFCSISPTSGTDAMGRDKLMSLFNFHYTYFRLFFHSFEPFVTK